jgi:hypothetical protein
MALKLWTRMNDVDVFTPIFRRKYWLRIVASCIFAVMLRNELTPDIDRICAAVGASSYGNLGKQIDIEVALLIVGGEAYSLDCKSRRHVAHASLRSVFSVVTPGLQLAF